MRLSSDAIRAATGGHWHGQPPACIEAIATDSRDFKAGQAFLALRGPHFDGHAFGRDVADRACAMIGDSAGMSLWRDLDVPQLEVTDTLAALGEIAACWRDRLEATRLIAITGSFGKTSLRSLLAHALKRLGFSVGATKANLNNLIGVPKTLLSIGADADFGIVECGISEIGEMQRLARIVRPDIAVLTGLAPAHAAGLGGLHGIAREKAILLDHVRPGGWVALGEGVSAQLAAAGVKAPADRLTAESAVIWELAGRHLQLGHGLERAALELALPARHWAANIALAAGILLRVLAEAGRPVSLESAAQALRDWQPEPGRMRMHAGANAVRILDDSYNANPASMQAALDTLAALKPPRIAILGDMAELGEASEAAHRSLDPGDIEQLILIGPQMRLLAETRPQARWFADVDEALEQLRRTPLPHGATVLVKASHSMGLARIVELLASQPEEKAHAV